MPKSRSRRRATKAGARPSGSALASGVIRDGEADLSASERVERDRQRRLRDWRRRRLLAGTLFALGTLVGISHWLEHLGAFTLYRSGVDDLIAGYPMAALLIFLGLMRLPAR